MQRKGKCELCGGTGLVADYGFNGEFICIDCSINDPKLANHVSEEMIRRHGKKRVMKWVEEAVGTGTRH